MNIEEFLTALKTHWELDKSKGANVTADFDKHGTIRIEDKKEDVSYCPITYVLDRMEGEFIEWDGVGFVGASDFLKLSDHDLEAIISAADQLAGWDEFPEIVDIHKRLCIYLGLSLDTSFLIMDKVPA